MKREWCSVFGLCVKSRLKTMLRLFWKFGAAKAMFPIGIANSLPAGQFAPDSRSTVHTGIVPALLVGATGTNCLKIEKLLVERPDSPCSSAIPSAVGAETFPGEAAWPNPDCSNWKKKNSLLRPLQ